MMMILSYIFQRNCEVVSLCTERMCKMWNAGMVYSYYQAILQRYWRDAHKMGRRFCGSEEESYQEAFDEFWGFGD